MNTVKGTIKPLRDNVLVVDMDFDEQRTRSGIIITSDDGKGHGVKPRWARVWAVGPDQTDVQVGEWVYVEHGRWTRGISVEDNGKEITIRMVEPKSIMLQSNEKPEDIYLGAE
ncbi:co-chaperone GroES [bacterium]|nr:co-chaperone GroES [Candidatus Elulimicrobium humile]